MSDSRHWPLVLRLGSAQTLAWASSYYLPALLARPMAQGLGIPVTQVWTAFSVALLLSAALGPFAGGAIDRWGGRPVLIGTSLIFSADLAGL
jgi:MFS-type transporter involved in bile tolerance (Atg22 family)